MFTLHVIIPVDAITQLNIFPSSFIIYFLSITRIPSVFRFAFSFLLSLIAAPEGNLLIPYSVPFSLPSALSKYSIPFSFSCTLFCVIHHIYLFSSLPTLYCHLCSCVSPFAGILFLPALLVRN